MRFNAGQSPPQALQGEGARNLTGAGLPADSIVERKRSAMRRGGLGIATEAQPAHSLQQVLGVVIVKSA